MLSSMLLAKMAMHSMSMSKLCRRRHNDGGCHCASIKTFGSKAENGTPETIITASICSKGYWKSCAPVKKVTAVFDTSKLRGKVYTVQGHDKTASKWYAKFDHVDTSLCPSGELNWHVHEEWSDAIRAKSSLDMCGRDLTGNHYDPTYGCGPASEFEGEVCKSARPNAQNGIQRCDLKGDVSTCEIGDLSSKVGRLLLNKRPQSWHDPFATNIKNYQYRSVVLHCCSDAGCAPRVACALLS